MTSARRIYEVSVELTMFVHAESESNAERIARNNVRDAIGDADCWARELRSNAKLPTDDRESLPWEDRNIPDDRFTHESTVGDILDALAADEKAAKELADFNARQVPLPLSTSDAESASTPKVAPKVDI